MLTLTDPLPSLVRASSWLLLPMAAYLMGAGRGRGKKSGLVDVWSLKPKWHRRFAGRPRLSERNGFGRRILLIAPLGWGLIRPWNIPYNWGKLFPHKSVFLVITSFLLLLLLFLFLFLFLFLSSSSSSSPSSSYINFQEGRKICFPIKVPAWFWSPHSLVFNGYRRCFQGMWREWNLKLTASI